MELELPMGIFRIYVWGCCARPMGLHGESRFLSWLRSWTYGACGIAAPDLWGSMVNLHCCCGCFLGPMGWTYGAVGPYVDFRFYVWGCCARPMGLYGESRFLLWLRSWTYGAYGIAAPDLWGSVVNLHCCCGCVLGPMG